MTEATIDLAAYRQNLSTLAGAVYPAEVMAVVKANAYGHGLVPIARAAVAHGVKWLGTLDIASALELRDAGIGGETSLFAWLLGPSEPYRTAIDARVDLGVSTVEQLEQIAEAGAATSARVHLKIDTGLHRNGALEAEWPQLVRRAVELEKLGLVEVHAAWTHIAEASDKEDSAAIARFDNAVAVAESLGAHFTLLHLAASAAGMAREDSRFDLVRIGAFSYGISPGGGITPYQLGLVPVMTLSARVVTDAEGNPVVPLGYGDGISSLAAGLAEVAVDGVLHPVDGIELDRMTLAGEPVLPGAEVTMFGPGSQGEWTLQQWADELGTIGEEIVTRLGRDIPRHYLGE
jgi:alanine racemase